MADSVSDVRTAREAMAVTIRKDIWKHVEDGVIHVPTLMEHPWRYICMVVSRNHIRMLETIANKYPAIIEDFILTIEGSRSDLERFQIEQDLFYKTGQRVDCLVWLWRRYGLRLGVPLG